MLRLNPLLLRNCQALLKIFLSFVCLFALSACAPSLRITPGEIPTPVPPSSELRSQAENYVHQHVSSENYREIFTGPELTRIRRVVDRLSIAAGYPPHIFPVHLVDAGSEVNAAAFNGASIVVYQELLRRIPDDAELATVIGHEIGHIVAKHYSEDEEQKGRAEAVSVGSSLLGTIASVATSAAGYGGAADLAGNVTEASTGLVGYGAFVGSFSRRQEYEADHIGLLIMAKAGYDPHRAIQFWKRADEVFGTTASKAGAFFNTHPAESDRQSALEEALPLAIRYYHPEAHAGEKNIATEKKRVKGKKGK